jgi:hypothetical protein
MYFIPRNNAIYNYIAHTSLKRCYLATLFFVGIFLCTVFYCAYCPLLSHITLLKSEQIMLQKKVEELAQTAKGNKELSTFVDTGKKTIADYAVTSDKREEHCHKRMLFVMDAIAQAGLVLSAYGSCKEKDKGWYSKDVAHFDVVGSMPKLMTLLETIKDSRLMITVSQVAMTRLGDNSFQMSFDAGVVMVKK